MASRSSQSSQRSTGGVNAAGNPLDTVVVISGDGRKKVLTLTWSYGANGGGIPVANLPFYGRLLVLAGVDASGYTAGGNLATGVMADLTGAGIASYGGRVVFDCDIQASNGAMNGQFTFPDSGNEGWVGVQSGPLTIILTAPVTSTGGLLTGVLGKLNVQFDNSYAKAPADGPPGYAYTAVSAASQ